ncbi:ubiquinol-cytochrome c reductase iron-sulfur subunit [Rhodoferax sp.]|uniref:ubiquinol-cytochrome c reductase iron-sulfur subunit n=1 Tax=Rhodoferax sp. TaxID=50421 RepID=UPI00261D4566|nr:ubiquinol-cytochrome c reductase iron-sulfur subunit [Rhodoferax sp.]MDD2919359.1 ubiquinol-cytochrome c reductase iron-sulfur subunit [Rhodoferax sp.]
MAPVRVKRRGLLLGAGAGAAAAGLAYWWKAKHADNAPQGSPLAVDLQDLPAGKLLTLNWQDKPVWVMRRSPAEIAALADHEELLLDADSRQSVQPPACRNRHRSLRPDIFVAVGLCTHLGCTPQLRGAEGFTCPCHASHYDLAGRVFKVGPAPANLVIPAYHFASENRLVLGASA